MTDLCDELEREARAVYDARQNATNLGSMAIGGSPELLLQAADEIRRLRATGAPPKPDRIPSAASCERHAWRRGRVHTTANDDCPDCLVLWLADYRAALAKAQSELADLKKGGVVLNNRRPPAATDEEISRRMQDLMNAIAIVSEHVLGGSFLIGLVVQPWANEREPERTQRGMQYASNAPRGFMHEAFRYLVDKWDRSPAANDVPPHERN